MEQVSLYKTRLEKQAERNCRIQPVRQWLANELSVQEVKETYTDSWPGAEPRHSKPCSVISLISPWEKNFRHQHKMWLWAKGQVKLPAKLQY